MITQGLASPALHGQQHWIARVMNDNLQNNVRLSAVGDTPHAAKEMLKSHIRRSIEELEEVIRHMDEEPWPVDGS